MKTDSQGSMTRPVLGRSRWMLAGLLAGSVLSAGACAKKKEEKPKEEVAAPAAPSQSPAEKRAQEQKEVEALAAQMQTQEDFEDQAEKEIADDGVEAELAKLETEIKADPDVAAMASSTPAAAASAEK